ncbi:hypothetical protein [Gordonia malaquae]|uniref:hypothetical protein n=1 Tax=Gordonia malaquae TaxID=410332 RepID=UPI00301A9E5F
MGDYTVFVVSSAPADSGEGGVGAWDWFSDRAPAEQRYRQWCQIEKETGNRSTVRLVELAVAVDPARLRREVDAELEVRTDEFEMTAPAIAQQVPDGATYRPVGATP